MEKPKYCVCKHAEFAHRGTVNVPPVEAPTSCDLCGCKEFRDRN